MLLLAYFSCFDLRVLRDASNGGFLTWFNAVLVIFLQFRITMSMKVEKGDCLSVLVFKINDTFKHLLHLLLLSWFNLCQTSKSWWTNMIFFCPFLIIFDLDFTVYQYNYLLLFHTFLIEKISIKFIFVCGKLFKYIEMLNPVSNVTFLLENKS